MRDVIRKKTNMFYPIILLVGIPIIIWILIKAIRSRMAINSIKAKIAKLNEETDQYFHEVKSLSDITPIESPIILKKDEMAFLSESCHLMETRSVRVSRSVGGGMRVARGMYLGSATTYSESIPNLKIVDSGTAVLTNIRIYFDGAHSDRNLLIKNLVSFKPHLDSIELSFDNRQKSVYLTVNNSTVWATMINLINKNNAH